MFRIETEVDKERHALLRSRLRETNLASSPALRALAGTGQDGELPLQVWASDASGALVGGLTGRTWAHWLHVELLWVDAGARGSGLGARLLAEAERRAREARLCTRSRVDTWDFQAPGFYTRQGYEIVGTVVGYPPGITEYTLVKTLN
ncbi:GNAT family N-acetyltransferase [Streptomyces sp. NPDC001941]|uniref:GNAT family N-acetyltransferase n=1 Tax=Streptomyces sp. NPDC001941 TaxID=3154659 RepID=UPI0033307B3D